MLPQFVNYSNNETMRNKTGPDLPMLYGHQQDVSQRDDEPNFMQRSNTQFNMRNQYYEPLPFEEQPLNSQQPYEVN